MTLSPSARLSGRMVERWVCSSCQLRSLKQSRNSFSTTTSHLRQERSSYSQLVQHRSQPNPSKNQKPFSTSPPNKHAQRREPKLPDYPARTRFAPSPTGYLHIGGLRTALFSYLLAKKTGGKFILRIEDTDQKRLVPDAEAKILSDLEWAGLHWDEGPAVGGPFGPYRQSERTRLYQSYADELLDNGSAYRCFCSPQSTGGAQIAYVTSGCYQNCSNIPSDEARRRAQGDKEPYTVRLRQPPDVHKRVYPDLVYGKIQRLKHSAAAPLTEDGEAGIGSADTMLLKSDGTPTYHFANVIDDHLMQITHVIRGVEWSASTPLHYDIYSAFNWTPPQFAHVGLLVDQNQAKLSKRNQDLALDVASMRDTHGVLLETLTNFLALLGWSNPTKNDVMSMDSLIDNFDLKFTRGNAMVRMEKLWFLQRKHVAELCSSAMDEQSFEPIKDLVAQITREVSARYPEFSGTAEYTSDHAVRVDKLTNYCAAILLADSANYQNAAQWVKRNSYFFAFDASVIPQEKEFYTSDKSVGPTELRNCERQLAQILDEPAKDDSSHQPLDLVSTLSGGTFKQEQWMRELLTTAVGERDDLIKPMASFLREKIAMGLPGPSIYLVMALLGPEECSRRLRLALGDGEGGGG